MVAVSSSSHLALDVSDQQLHLLLRLLLLSLHDSPLITQSLSVDQRKLQVEPVRQARRSLRASRVGRDDDGRRPIRNRRFDVAHNDGLGVEVVDRDIKEPLDLRRMEIHGDDVVGASHGDEVRDEPRSQMTVTSKERGGREHVSRAIRFESHETFRERGEGE